jgi:pimeloyl-ACP methyl ester carboxylesterase
VTLVTVDFVSIGILCAPTFRDRISMRVAASGLILTLVVVGTAFAASERKSANAEREHSTASASSPVIILGFLGGHVRHDNMLHTEVQLASRLRAEFSASAHAEVFENRRESEAFTQVLRLLDADRDGELSETEKRGARIILYGHSWGAAAVIALARQLEKDSIPVLLTIQVDSITRHHVDDALVPANVSEAINFYQPDSVLHGRPEIRAVDSQHTKILGNFRFDYKASPVSCSDGYPWLVRHFAKPHAEIECDPSVWNQVEALIRSKLVPAPEAAQALATSSAKTN